MSIRLVLYIIMNISFVLSMVLFLSFYAYVLFRSEKAHAVFDVIRWPGLVGVYVMTLLPPYSIFLFAFGVLICWTWTNIVRNHKCDNDRWKKLKDKANGVVREIQGRLVVVPADLVPVPA